MKYFQVSQEDLEELEKVLPEWADEICMKENALPVRRRQFEVVQNIVQRIRWNYGPPREVERIE